MQTRLTQRGQHENERACVHVIQVGFAERLDAGLAELARMGRVGAGRLKAECLNMVWSHPGSRSWYKNDRGVVINTSPWRLIDYWAWTKSPDLAEYKLA